MTMARTRPAGRSDVLAGRLLRIAGAAMLGATAAVHLRLYTEGYSGIHVIGPLFLLNGIAGASLCLAVLATRDRLLAAVAGSAAMFELGTIVGLVVTISHGLFGFTESAQAPLVATSLTVEATGAAVLFAVLVAGSRPRLLRAPVAGAALCAAIVGIHVADQGGVTAMTDPTWLGWAYRLLELGAAGTVLWLLSRIAVRAAWWMSLPVAVGPFAGYLLTRTVGLPGDGDDIGSWGAPLGWASLAVELSLAALAVVALADLRRSSPASPLPGWPSPGERAEPAVLGRPRVGADEAV